jgi:hypothetical protein
MAVNLFDEMIRWHLGFIISNCWYWHHLWQTTGTCEKRSESLVEAGTMLNCWHIQKAFNSLTLQPICFLSVVYFTFLAIYLLKAHSFMRRSIRSIRNNNSVVNQMRKAIDFNSLSLQPICFLSVVYFTFLAIYLLKAHSFMRKLQKCACLLLY